MSRLLRFSALFAVLLAAGVSAPSRAALCGLDRAPGSTLLLPYFRVNLANPGLETTLLAINNADLSEALVKVVLWSDLSYPVFDFDVYLSGRDVETINLRDVLNGNLPASFPPMGSFPGCGPVLPTVAPIYPPLVPYLADALSGQAVIFPGTLTPVQLGSASPGIAQGFLTVDVVGQCTTSIVSDPGFWISGGSGVGQNRNILWGDYFYVDVTNGFAQGFNLVQLEADASLGAGTYTFYRRFNPAGEDNREPLATLHSVRYAHGGAFSGETRIFYWRDPKRTINPFAPGPPPAPFPLDQTQILIYDEQENVSVPAPGNYFPYAAGQVEVGTDIPTPYPFGVIYVDLNTTVAGSQVPFEPADQATLAYAFRALGQFSVGMDSTALDTAPCP
jgi:hypothetical protein